MATYGHPGTYVNEVLLLNPPNRNDTTAVSVFVGAANRGPTVPTRFSSVNDVRKLLGDFTGVEANDRLLQATYDAFNRGSHEIWVNRIPGTGAVVSTLVLNDNAGTPAPALHFTATNPGAWGNQIYLEVGPGFTTDRFTITIRLVPTGAAITNAQIVDRINDLSLDPTDPRYALSVINNVGQPNAFVSVALATGFTFTAGLTPPMVLKTSTVTPGGDVMASGADGTRDGATLDAAARHDAVYALDAITSPFVLNLPGVTDAVTVDMVANYADASYTRTDGLPGRGDVFVVVDVDAGASPSTAATKAGTYNKSDAVAVYGPWLLIPDPSNSLQNATKLVPGGPAVVGRYIATDTVKGPFKSPAGISDGLISGVLMTDPNVSLRSQDLDVLMAANINVIKPVIGYGPAVIFGARTLKSDYITRYVSARRTIIFMRAALLQATAFAPFENNDNVLWAHLSAVADKICRELMAAGGLKGASAKEAYYVVCNGSNNTEDSIAAGEVHLEVGLAIQRPAEFVVITIGQTQSGISVTDTTQTA